MTRFRTPDGLRFVTYQAAQQHWSREKLRQWLRDNAPMYSFDAAFLHQRDVMLDELADRLRQDWHISKRNPPEREYFAIEGADPVVDAIVDDLFAGKGTM